MLAYSKSRDLSSLVEQLTYWVKLGRVVAMVTWLEQPKIAMRALVV